MEAINNLIDLMRWMDEQGIPGDDPRRQQAYSRFMDGKARNTGTPLTGIFELTPLCNFDCKMCYVHLTPEQMRGRAVLRAKEWISLMDQAIDMGMISAQLTGGEAMMHPDFDEIYLYLRKRGIRVALLTNGLLLTEERITFLKENPPASLQMTVYGGDEDGYERLTGCRVYHQVLEHIVAAKEIDTRIVISTTPSRYFGIKELEAVKSFCQENGLKMKVNKELNAPREETGRSISDFALTDEEIFELQVYSAGKDIHHLEKVVENLPAVGSSQEPAYGLHCGAGRSLFCINWQGQMKACLDLEEYEEPMKLGMQEAWRRIHEYATHYKVPRECIGCLYVTVCNPCPVIHAMGAPKGHVDRRLCARMRRLVETGCVALPEK